jgi:16S rRNA (adenine1518-N6/adenine1519-N6)-dimethyltransferase
MPRPKLGQHWLQDRRICARIARAVKLAEDETCIEIGGGKGALTRELAGRCRRLIVYEIDPRWAEHLREHGMRWGEGVEVREGDALRIEWSREALDVQSDEPLVVTGNLPYYLASPLLLRLAYSRLDFRRAVVLIQKEVAERIASKPGDSAYGRLTVSLRAFSVSELLFNVPPEAFKPPPRVTSTLIRLTPLVEPLVEAGWDEKWERTVESAFAMRRKTLKNNLRTGYPDIPVERIDAMLEQLGINPKARAQELDVGMIAKLMRLLGEES